MNFLSSDLDTRFLLLNHGSVEIADRWRQRQVRSSFWRIYVHDRDGAEAVVGGTRYPLGPNRVHLLPAWMRFDHRTARPVRQFHASFDLVRWTARLTNRLAPLPIGLAFDAGMRSAWAAVRRGYAQGNGASAATAVRINALICAALAAWIDTLDDDAALGIAAGRGEVEPALVYIENHLHEPLSNAMLAELCHYSTDHFAKVFRGVVGQTPARYVVERRVAQAAQALAFSDRSIDAIAESLGFGNRFYFSRQFKRHLGTPPAAYRASVRFN